MKQQLTEEQKSAIHNLRVKSGEALRAGKSDESIALSLQAWEVLPEPKIDCAESWHIVQGLIFISLYFKDYMNAEKYVETLFSCDRDRIDDGEREYIAGKVAFESDKKEKALQFFKIANEKSTGRCWDPSEKKYKAFFKTVK